MTTIGEPSGPFAACFGHRLGFFEHLKACWPRTTRPFAPARRFSARFGHTRWCANLLQHRRHDAATLSWCQDLATAFPGAVERLAKMTSQNQVVHGGSDNHAPALKLFGGAHMHLRPEQILLEKAIGVLMRKAPLIGRGHLLQGEG